MKALCWHGKSDMRYETVPDPKIQHPQDATIKVTACAICGSDLHIYNGVIPEMESGNVLGHETQAVSGRPPWRNRGCRSELRAAADCSSNSPIWRFSMDRSIRIVTLASSVLLLATGLALAQELTVDINRISDTGVGEKIGTVTISEAKGGAAFKVAVTGLSKGQRGFHVHEKGDCGPAMKDGKMTAGIAAGEHYDPEAKKSHKGPQGAGHKGDLPLLNATDKGISQTVTAPRLKLAEVRGRALVIHEGGDNYSDQPDNGGGKGRVACGVVPKQ